MLSSQLGPTHFLRGGRNKKVVDAALGESFSRVLVSTEKGTETKMELASLFGTWPARGLDSLQACLEMLVSPQV